MKGFALIVCLLTISFGYCYAHSYTITSKSNNVVDNTTFGTTINPGDTIFIDTSRVAGLYFNEIEGSIDNPIVVINKNGVVEINDPDAWAALQFKNCKYFKVTGTGNPDNKYGFKLSAKTTGVGITELSSDFVVENISIQDVGFSGIQAKKDYSGNPPYPYPEFNNLVIHDCFISDVEEGMYLGETKTPGMIFKHVRIYNNIVSNILREGIQIANMVEDVEVCHNIVLNTGLLNLSSHGNGIQIGDNTVGSFHHNVIIGCTEYGYIVFGAGDIEIFDNYIAENKGAFFDNRKVSLPYSDIHLTDNHFRDIGNDYVVTIYNDQNDFYLQDNTWLSEGVFLYSNLTTEVDIVEENNQKADFNSIIIENYQITETNPTAYLELGPKENLGYEFNYLPEIEAPDNIIIEWEESDTINISAQTVDNDGISFDLLDSLAFTGIKDNENGTAKIYINPEIKDQGIYTSTLIAWDHSHQHKTRKQIHIGIKNPENQPPKINPQNDIVFKNLQLNMHLIGIDDPDGDQLTLTSNNFPDFVKIYQGYEEISKGTDPLDSLTSTISPDLPIRLECKPRYFDVGNYDSLSIKIDDGYGEYDSVFFNIQVNQGELTNGKATYRVNCGGPEVEDENLNWEDSYYNDLSYQITTMHNSGSHYWKGSNSTAAPDDIFGPFCYQYETGDNMKWQFPVENGRYRVNLCFIERQTDIDNDRLAVFNVFLQEETWLNQFSIYNEAGLVPHIESKEVEVTNQNIQLEFETISNRSKVNGIEIVFLSEANDPPEITDIEDIDIYADETLTVEISASDPEDDSIEFNIQNLPGFATFEQDSPQNARLILAPGSTDIGKYSDIIITASDLENLTDSDTINIQVLFNNSERLIPICSDNIYIENDIDPVVSPDVLFDEQDINPENGEHPVSNSWKPASNFDSGPYHFYIDFNHQINITEIAMHDMENQGTIRVSAGAPENWTPLFEEPCDAQNEWKTHHLNTETRYLRFSMVETVESAVNEILITGFPVPGRILLQNADFIDEVPGGSVQPFTLLFDEQELNPSNNEHAQSLSWKPAYNSNNAPYSAYIDLQEPYVIESLWIHDMNNNELLEISASLEEGEDTFFSEKLNHYNSWIYREVNVISRYITFTMPESHVAEINEVMLNGYPACNKVVTSAKSIKTASEISVYPNPASDEIYIQTPNSAMKFNIELISLGGQKILHKQITNSIDANVIKLNLTNKNIVPGIYLIRAYNESEVYTQKIIVL